jgi:hypothetical protein
MCVFFFLKNDKRGSWNDKRGTPPFIVFAIKGGVKTIIVLIIVFYDKIRYIF